MPPMLYYENFKTQHEELIRQAEYERLVKLALAGQPRALDRIQTRTGRLLVKIGSHLQAFAKSQGSALDEEGRG